MDVHLVQGRAQGGQEPPAFARVPAGRFERLDAPLLLGYPSLGIGDALIGLGEMLLLIHSDGLTQPEDHERRA